MPPEFQIVVLDMTLEEQMERVRKRHAGDERMVEFAKVRDIKTSYILGQGRHADRFLIFWCIGSTTS